MEILHHLHAIRTKPVVGLEVGIGAGENLAFLPRGWNVYGVDIARTQLEACVRRHPSLSGCLAWAEGENLPFADAVFDACWSVGGFNYYSDHEAALREMHRVTKPGGLVIVADENPGLHRAGLGHLLGAPAFDAWWLRCLGLDSTFVEMVLHFDVDLVGLCAKVWPGATRHRIWHGLGYYLVDNSQS
jgi:ubiquinone/menaquinone biosynthesis C-methylase UbiE